MVKVIGDALLDRADLRLCLGCLAMMSECLPDRWVGFYYIMFLKAFFCAAYKAYQTTQAMIKWLLHF